jgi:hypothetical protein
MHLKKDKEDYEENKNIMFGLMEYNRMERFEK